MQNEFYRYIGYFPFSKHAKIRQWLRSAEKAA